MLPCYNYSSQEPEFLSDDTYFPFCFPSAMGTWQWMLSAGACGVYLNAAQEREVAFRAVIRQDLLPAAPGPAASQENGALRSRQVLGESSPPTPGSQGLFSALRLFCSKPCKLLAFLPLRIPGAGTRSPGRARCCALTPPRVAPLPCCPVMVASLVLGLSFRSVPVPGWVLHHLVSQWVPSVVSHFIYKVLCGTWFVDGCRMPSFSSPPIFMVSLNPADLCRNLLMAIVDPTPNNLLGATG